MKMMMMCLLMAVMFAVLPTLVHARELAYSPATHHDFGRSILEDEVDASSLRIFFENFTREEYIDFHVNLLTEEFPVFQKRSAVIEGYLRLLWQRSLEYFGNGLNTLTMEQTESLIKIPEIQQIASEVLSLSEEDVAVAAAASGCSYTGVTMYDKAMTEAAGYKFQSHFALYFRVDGNANCYKKECAVGTCCGNCGDKKIPYWQLQCKDKGCPWYVYGQKYVKDVVMLVPTTWWSVWYWWVPASTKASWFWMSWSPTNTGMPCCDPGCGG